MVLSVLMLFAFSFMFSFVEAAQGLDQDCNRGIIATLLGQNCAKGLYCETTSFEPADGYSGRCKTDYYETLERGSPIIQLDKVFDSNTGKDPQLFDRILVFILVSVVMFGIFDKVSIFGKKNKWINFVIGGVLGLIGVRFLPDDIIIGLSTPTTALTALIFAGLPFLAVYFIANTNFTDNKGNNTVFPKFIWLAYSVFVLIMSIINYVKTPNLATLLIGIVFAILGFVMMATISTKLIRQAKKDGNTISASAKGGRTTSLLKILTAQEKDLNMLIEAGSNIKPDDDAAIKINADLTEDASERVKRTKKALEKLGKKFTA